MRYSVPFSLLGVSKKSSIPISELFLILIGLIEAVSQQISPKLKLLYKIPTSGAIDSALKGTFITSPPLIRILKEENKL